MHDEKTARPTRKVVKPGPPVPGQAALRTKRLEAKHRRLEVLDVFDAARALDLNLLDGHVVAEARLDYVTDGSFDDTDDEKARVEQAGAEVANARVRCS